MTKTELLETITNGESSSVEFKRDDINSRQLARELVAFVNFEGGRVLMGVEDDGSISGITREPGDLEEFVMNSCRDKVRPGLIPHFQMVRDVEPGRHVAIIEVERGWTVHSVWHNQRPHYYIRVGTESREMYPEELERLFQRRGTLRAELRAVSGSSLNDLDRRRLIDYFQRVRQQETPERDDQSAWEQLLVNTEILSEEDDPAPCTMAGLLLFGRNPNRFLPQAGITAVAYPGTEKDYAAVERATLRGSIVGLFRREDGAEILEPGLVEQAIHFVRRNIGVEARLVEGARREERRTYPDEAVREAVVNALVHRDYLLSATDIEIALYSDRLEIISPGRLPNGITPDRMRTGCRAARNQLLKDTLRDYGYMEHIGLGVPRKIIRLMREHNGTEPDLEEGGEEFTVRLRRRVADR